MCISPGIKYFDTFSVFTFIVLGPELYAQKKQIDNPTYFKMWPLSLYIYYLYLLNKTNFLSCLNTVNTFFSVELKVGYPEVQSHSFSKWFRQEVRMDGRFNTVFDFDTGN